MCFYEVIYENPGVEKARARKRSHQLPSLWGARRGGFELQQLDYVVVGSYVL